MWFKTISKQMIEQDEHTQDQITILRLLGVKEKELNQWVIFTFDELPKKLLNVKHEWTEGE